MSNNKRKIASVSVALPPLKKLKRADGIKMDPYFWTSGVYFYAYDKRSDLTNMGLFTNKSELIDAKAAAHKECSYKRFGNEYNRRIAHEEIDAYFDAAIFFAEAVSGESPLYTEQEKAVIAEQTEKVIEKAMRTWADTEEKKTGMRKEFKHSLCSEKRSRSIAKKILCVLAEVDIGDYSEYKEVCDITIDALKSLSFQSHSMLVRAVKIKSEFNWRYSYKDELERLYHAAIATIAKSLQDVYEEKL